MRTFFKTIKKSIGISWASFIIGTSSFVTYFSNAVPYISSFLEDSFDLEIDKSIPALMLAWKEKLGLPDWATFTLFSLLLITIKVVSYASKIDEGHIVSIRRGFELIAKSKFGLECLSSGLPVDTCIREEVKRACLEEGLILYVADVDSCQPSYILRDYWNFAYISSAEPNENGELRTVVKSGNSIKDVQPKRITGISTKDINRLWPAPFFIYPVYVQSKVWLKSILGEKYT